MSRYKALFFDFDGTICDTYDGIEQIFDLTFAHYGLDIPRSQYRKYIGPPLNETFEALLGSSQRAYEAVDFFRLKYDEENAIFRTKLYDGIAQLLAHLHSIGYTVAVATCKKEEEAIRLLRHFGVDKDVDFVSGLRYHERETKAQVLRHGLDMLHVTAENCLMIGDTHFDVDGAAEVDMDCALCLWGFGDYDAIHSPNVVVRVQSPQQLADWLDKEV